jgi:hypothetical protein
MTRARDNSFNPFNNNYAGKNLIINGGMDIWQRGTSFTFGSSSVGNYSADRWVAFRGSVYNYTRQENNDTTNLPFLQYCLRVQRFSGQFSTSSTTIAQALESASSIPYAGKIVTLSFYARAGADYSPTSSLLRTVVQNGTGTDQPPVSTFTGAVSSIDQSVTLTTTWQRFTITSASAVSNLSTQLQVLFIMSPTGTAGAADYFEITGVQLEIGSAATLFSRAGGTIGGELSLCQRYFQSSFPIGTAPANSVSPGTIFTMSANGNLISGVPFPVPMRATPSFLTYNPYAANANWRRANGSTDITLTSVVANGNTGISYVGTSGFTATGSDSIHGHWSAAAEL